MEKYAFKNGKYSSHSVILRLCGESSSKKALDVGCGNGEIANRLFNAGWIIDTIEINSLSDDGLKRRIRNQFSGDLCVPETFNLDKYDLIIFGDVLEHLVNPYEVLLKYRDFLEPQGSIVISVPNIANIYTRLTILIGRFNYTDSGILDKTHLRFFTLKTLLKLLEESKLIVSFLKYSIIPFELKYKHLRFFFESKFWQFTLHAITSLLPKLFAYQFIVKVERIS